MSPDLAWTISVLFGTYAIGFAIGFRFKVFAQLTDQI